MKRNAYWLRTFVVFILLTIIELAIVTVDTVVFTVKYNKYPHVEATVISETVLDNDDSPQYSYVLSYMYHNEEFTGKIIRNHKLKSSRIEVTINPKNPTYVLDTPQYMMLRILIILFIAAMADLLWYIERDAEKSRLASLIKPCIGIHVVGFVIAVIFLIHDR